MHYLVTGHTGFKGSWLTLLLKARGHTVSGLALDPPAGGLYETANLHEVVEHDLRIDIRDADATAAGIASVSPDVVIHMAAQPLVRQSYKDPRETMETNVVGTMNVLAGVQATASVKAHVVITTDKVYRNVNQEAGYVESDPLGGDDPYSASKAMADILTQSWIKSFPGTPTALARAGNVIGGGDVSSDRLLVDLINSYAAGVQPMLRYPQAVRPWQHVLDCVNGYTVLAEALLEGRGLGEWNFGPGRDSFVDVAHVADLVAELWGGGASWAHDSGQHPHEANLLALDAAKAEAELDWHNRLTFRESVEWTVGWDRATRSGTRSLDETISQIAAFEAKA